MIYCTNQNYFKVFGVKETDKTIRYRCGSSEEVRGSYKNSNWDVVVFKSNVQVPMFKEGDLIVATKLKVENIYDKANDRNWLSVVLLEAKVYG